MQENIINHWQQDIIPDSHQDLKNQTLYWRGSDTIENFKKNLTPGYTATSITYVYNSYGYREEEYNLTSKSNILCLGCSHTEGVGLKLEDCWPSILKKQFSDSKVYNFGVSSGGCDTVARILANTSGVFKPQAVFVLWPSIARYELYEDTTPVFYGPWSTEVGLYDLITDAQTYNNFCKNKLIVELLQYKYNFKLFELWSDDLMEDASFSRLVIESPARDGHFGPRQHQEIIRRFMEQYNAN